MVAVGPRSWDVLVVGGGPAGSTAATLMVHRGLSVALAERETFPRFHVGESLLPANTALFDRLGVHEAIRKAGPLVKYGAAFHDQESDLGYAFRFRQDGGLPGYGYQVKRAEFDAILLDHARSRGVHVVQPATVTRPVFDRDGVTVEVERPGGVDHVHARFLVDASGREGFLARAVGRRHRRPNLGKVALFAHQRGARRFAGIEEGHIRIYVFPDGWFWWIPFAGDVTSVGAVLHARTVRSWTGSLGTLYDAMIARVPAVEDGLAGAERVGPVHRMANFAYRNRPVVGNRFLSPSATPSRSSTRSSRLECTSRCSPPSWPRRPSVGPSRPGASRRDASARTSGGWRVGCGPSSASSTVTIAPRSSTSSSTLSRSWGCARR